jgi:uncharacterized peroxidase-related enzyme
MARIDAVDPREAEGEGKDLLEEIKSMLGRTPNLIKTMAHSPPVLKGYLDFSSALGEGGLSPKLRERIALAVSEKSGCFYCVSAHTAIAKRMGLSEEETLESRQGSSMDAKEDAAINFALKVMDKGGRVSNEDLEKVRKAGYDDARIIEIVAHVAMSLFTNYINHVAETAVDYPKAPELAKS